MLVLFLDNVNRGFYHSHVVQAEEGNEGHGSHDPKQVEGMKRWPRGIVLNSGRGTALFECTVSATATLAKKSREFSSVFVFSLRAQRETVLLNAVSR